MSNPVPYTGECHVWTFFYLKRRNVGILTSKIPWQPLPDDMMEWCKTCIQGRWTWASEGGHGRPIFFEEDRDAMMFKLAWHESIAFDREYIMKMMLANGLLQK